MILPFLVDDVRNVIWIAVLYFIGSLFVLLNFPALSLAPQSKPFYITDLVENESDKRFVAVYETLMIIVMSGMMAAFADYIYLRDVENKSATEILAIVGGNVTVYLKIQSITGKIMLKFCVCWRNRERSLSSEDAGESV